MKLMHTAALAIAVLSLNAHAAPEICSADAVQSALNGVLGYDTSLLNGGSIYPHCFVTSRSGGGDTIINRINQRFFPRRQNRVSAREICGLSLADTIRVIQAKLGCN